MHDGRSEVGLRTFRAKSSQSTVGTLTESGVNFVLTKLTPFWEV
jgi:hypothetical protein